VWHHRAAPNFLGLLRRSSSAGCRIKVRGESVRGTSIKPPVSDDEVNDTIYDPASLPQRIRVEASAQESIHAAVYAVRQWRYRPTLLNGLPVDVQTGIEVSFTPNR
jgi:hypothetical protein